MWTRGTSCKDFCGKQGRDCVHAQNNLEESCDLDPAHERQDMSQNGCLQLWDNQICACSAVKDGPTTNSSIISTRVLGLEYSSTNGEELRMKDLETPFVLELSLDEGAFACNAVSGNLELCSDYCVPRGSCANREHQHCSFFNVDLDSWEFDRKSRPGRISADGRKITCEFDHLTDVTSFLGPSPREVFNEPCFSCINDFLQNPWGIAIVLSGLVALLCISTITLCKFYRYSHRRPDQIAESKFAHARKEVLASDKKHKTSLTADVIHKLRHDFHWGGIICQLPGDPFDWSQRALMMVTMLLVNLMVSLMFFQPDTDSDPACTEQCEQQTKTAEEVCTTVCNEPEKSGLLISVATAVISVPLTMAVDKALQWLRKPILVAVEPKEQRASIATMVKTHRAALKAKSWLKNQTTVAATGTRVSDKSAWFEKGGTKVVQKPAAHAMPHALSIVAEKQKIAITGLRCDTSSDSDTDSTMDADSNAGFDADTGVEHLMVLRGPQKNARSKEGGTRPAAPVARVAFAEVAAKEHFGIQAKSRQKQRSTKPLVGDLDAYVAAAIAHNTELRKRRTKGNIALPRKPVAACVPVLVGLICGLLCLFMIYGIAAKLGPVSCRVFVSTRLDIGLTQLRWGITGTHETVVDCNSCLFRHDCYV